MCTKKMVEGDRHLDINQSFPEKAFYHLNKNGNLLDVTKPPFNAKGDGVSDDTAALNAAMRFVRDHYEAASKDDKTYCIQRQDRNWIIYLPDGVYLVNDTISQGWPAMAMNILNGWSHVEYMPIKSPIHEAELCSVERPILHGNPLLDAANDNNSNYSKGQYNEAKIYAEINWAIRMIGQSRRNTVIRLKDSSPGYKGDSCKPVVSFYMLQRGSNINLGNMFENITIDTGHGNPGAVGLQWNSSNWGSVSNVAILASQGEGRVGLMMGCNNATGYHRDLLIDGFDVGIKLSAGRESMITLEFATFNGQRNTAIMVGDAGAGGGGDSLSARKLNICNVPQAMKIGRGGQVVLLDSQITLAGTPQSALEVGQDGFLLARNITISGCKVAVTKQGKSAIQRDYIAEYFSSPPIKCSSSLLLLPIEDSPTVLPESELANWACVEDFGAAGDGHTDDTAAIQRAMNSGKPVVAFTRTSYVINGTVDIPAGVREITFIFAAVQRSHATEFDGPGLFRVSEASSEPLYIHRGITAGGVFLDHAAARPVLLEDIFVIFNHIRSLTSKDEMLLSSSVPQNTEIWRLYRNATPDSTPKKLFVNNCIGFAGDNQVGTLAVENVRMWGRMLNTEHVPGGLYSFKKSEAWILGFKSEGADTLLSAKDHSKLEVLGGSFLNFSQKHGPVVISNDSQLSAMFYLWHWAIAPKIIWSGTVKGKATLQNISVFKQCNTVDAGVIFIR